MIRLSYLSPEIKEHYLNYYNNVLLSGASGFKFIEPTPDFNELGLRFPIEYLNEMGKNIIFLPLEIAAEYVDGITKNFIDENNEEFIFHQVLNVDYEVSEMYENLNATGIGNMAYICLNCQNEKARTICDEFLKSVFGKEKGKLLDHLHNIVPE